MKIGITVIVVIVAVGLWVFLNVFLEKWQMQRNPSPVFVEPTLRLYSTNQDNYDYIELDYNEKENNLFLLIKEIYCSDNPYAKELVEKYKIRSDNIRCKKGDNP